MADLRVISILPSQPVSGVAQSHVPTGAGSQSASVISSLTPGTILTGFIVNRDKAGNPVLRTETGDITFSSQFFLKIGSEIVIRVENTGGNTLAHILTVDGQPPEIAEKLSAFAHEPEVIIRPQTTTLPNATPINAHTPVNAPPVRTEPVLTVTGTLISQPQSASVPGAPALPTGTQLVLNIVNLNVVANATPVEFSLGVPPQEPLPPSFSSQANSAHYAAYSKASVPAPPVASPTAIPTTVKTVAEAPLTPAQPVTAQPTATQPVTPAATPPAATPPLTAEQPAATRPVTAAVTPLKLPSVSVATLPPNIVAITASALPATPAHIPASVPATPITTPSAPVTSQPAAAQPAPPAAQPPAPVPASFTTGEVIAATVIGREPSGEALVQTPVGVIRLQAGTSIPQGSTITFQIVQTDSQALNTNPTTAQATQTIPAPLRELAQQWTSLQQISDLLVGRDVSQNLFVLPHINLAALAAAPDSDISPKTISSGLLLFISALRGGDFRGWVGKDNIRWLTDSGHEDLVRKAESEFIGLARQFTAEVKPHQWQPLFFPVAVDGLLQQVRIFVKRDRKQGNTPQSKENEDTRFIIEVDLSQLGELQMDGFIRKHDKEVQFDMMIRSLHPLSAEIQQDILQLYNEAGALTGYKGSLVFQSVKEFPVNPMEDIVAAEGTVVA